MKNSQVVGRQGELLAGRYLQNNGFTILETNYHSQFGEIDLICQKGDLITFVEVKTRKQGSQVDGFAAVTASKQRKIIATALEYLSKRNLDVQLRFDVCSIIYHAGRAEIDYLEAAFTA